MLNTRLPLPLTQSALALLAVVCAPGTLAAANSQIHLNGSIVGFVRGPQGLAQIGASVVLMNRFDHLVQRVLTNEQGAFAFDSLLPDVYSIRVLQTSFAPASKSGVRVTPGERSFLSIQLASLISSVQLVGSSKGTATLMTDEWKWVLRSASASRPALRFLPTANPQVRIDDPQIAQQKHNVFSETRGVFAVSAGEGGNFQASSVADMGTAFALSTQIFGTTQVMFTGNVGYSPANGAPAAGFRTAYRRNTEDDFFNPEFKLTVQQVFMPMNTPARFGDASNMPAVRSMSAAVSDHLKFSEHLSAEIGTSLDSVSYGSRMNYVSPYAIVALNLEKAGVVELGFSSGIPPIEAYQGRRGAPSNAESADLRQNVNALALMPRVTLRDGTARVQRSENYEVSYRKEFGSRTVSMGLFREGLSNAALTMSSSDGIYPADVVPDFNSQTGVFNIGDFTRTGFSASASQRFTDALTVAVIFSRGGALRSEQRQLVTDDPDEIRSSIRRSQQNAIAARASGIVPRIGTAYSISYQWTDYRALTPGHLFLTNLGSPNAGLNISVRQRVPTPGFIPGHMEVSAEMRNLMAQGYLPLSTIDGRRLLLIHTPRAVRGGVAFYF